MKRYSKDNKIFLRPFIESDIEDCVDWFTVTTEWQNWDAPWETDEDTAESIRTRYTSYYDKAKTLEQGKLRSRFELCINNKDETHIGWVSYYHINEEYKYTKDSNKYAIGIDVCDPQYRKNGYGTSALLTFIEYLNEFNISTIYTQTWSGNHNMIKLATKLGFIECNRIKDLREVKGTLYDGVTFRLDC